MPRGARTYELLCRGLAEDAAARRALYEEMVAAGGIPEAAGVALLRACANGGDADLAVSVFEAMKPVQSTIKPLELLGAWFVKHHKAKKADGRPWVNTRSWSRRGHLPSVKAALEAAWTAEESWSGIKMPDWVEADLARLCG